MRTLDLASFGRPSAQKLHERRRTHAVVFDDPELALAGAKRLRECGFLVADAHTPFPVHGLDEALGLAKTRVSRATLLGGLLGGGLGFGFQLWSHAIDWPLNIGGKSHIAWQALLPVTFETTVLVGAFATVGALLFAGRLFPGRDIGRHTQEPLSLATDDRFVLLVAEHDGGFSPESFREVCKAARATEIVDAWRVD